MNENRMARYQALKADIMPTFVLSPRAAMHELIECILDLQDQVVFLAGALDSDKKPEDE